MKKNLNFTQKKTWLRLIIVSLIILVLGAASCDLIFPKSGPNINKFIQAYWGIDVSDSAQVAGLILGMQAVGNKEAIKGLTAYSHCRSEMYQERGDKLLGMGDTAGARLAYEEAFKWAQDNTPHRASDKAGIYYQYANTYMKDAQGQKTVIEQTPYYRAAGQNMLNAAKIEPVPANKAFYYRSAAFHLAVGGDKKTGKKAYDEAAKLEPNSLALEQMSGLFK